MCDDELELDGLFEGLPGTPCWAAFGGGIPSGGLAFAGCAASQD
jgi:hypothetical protein